MRGVPLFARLAGALVLSLTAHLAPGSASTPIYWPVAKLDTRPQVATHVMPVYPPELVSGIRGRVVLELFISDKGVVDRIRVVSAEPPGRFEQASVQAFTQARFTPGMRKGRPVRSRMRIEVSFGD